MMDQLQQLARCIERGKSTKDAPYPPDMKGQDGSVEITKTLLETGVPPSDILKKGFMVGMRAIGDKFSQGKAFIPELLISAKAMNAAMVLLKPYFDKGDVTHHGTIILGTVSGDLHDIGKNIVKMVLEGDGWKVIDLGTDVNADKFLKALEENPTAIIGMSALLTTTMVHMEPFVKTIKSQSPDTKIFIGGAPVTQAYNDQIGADGYFSDPHNFVKYLAQ